MCIVGQEMATWIDTFSKAKKTQKNIILFFIDLSTIHYFITVFQLGFQKGRVLVLKKGSLVRCWIFKKGIF